MFQGKPHKFFSNILLIALFLVAIAASPLKMILGEENHWSESERRSLALKPALPSSLQEIPDFFSAVDKYLEDHFGYREFFIFRYQTELDEKFNQAGMNAKVITGLDGWFFYNEFDLLKDFRGKLVLSPEQLKEWVLIQDEKFSWLQSKGIKYLLLAAPNKQAIHPEFLMENPETVKRSSRFEQLLEYRKKKLPPYMIDLHSLLQTDLFSKPLYYKNDTHWNKLAAYVTFREIFKRISAWFPDESFQTEFEFVEDETGIGGNTGEGGDLTRILMKKELQETYPQIKRFKRCGPYKRLPYELSNIAQSSGRISFTRYCGKRNLKAVIFRDSFFVPVEPFFSENFSEVVYLWKGYDQKNIEELLSSFKPDVVIEIQAERHLFDSILELDKTGK